MAEQSQNQSKYHDEEKFPDAALSEQTIEKETADETKFPEGGARAWSVALGAGGVMFSTLGYTNAFG